MFEKKQIYNYRLFKKSIMQIGMQIKPFTDAAYDIQKTIDFLIRSDASHTTIDSQKTLKEQYNKKSEGLRDEMARLQAQSTRFKTHYETVVGSYAIVVDFHATGSLIRLKEADSSTYISEADYLMLGSEFMYALADVVAEVEKIERSLK